MEAALVRRPVQARRRAFAQAIGVALAVIGLDQLTKHTIGTSVAPGQVKTLIPGIVHFVRVRNPGVAFGFLPSGGVLVYSLIALALIALVGYLGVHPQRPWLWLPTGMLIGGAVGNLIDRIAFGSVIDFVKLPHWPAFNLADASITLGVIVLLFVIESGRARADKA